MVFRYRYLEKRLCIDTQKPTLVQLVFFEVQSYKNIYNHFVNHCYVSRTRTNFGCPDV